MHRQMPIVMKNATRLRDMPSGLTTGFTTSFWSFCCHDLARSVLLLPTSQVFGEPTSNSTHKLCLETRAMQFLCASVPILSLELVSLEQFPVFLTH